MKDLVIFTEKILNGKLHFCAVRQVMLSGIFIDGIPVIYFQVQNKKFQL